MNNFQPFSKTKIIQNCLFSFISFSLDAIAGICRAVLFAGADRSLEEWKPADIPTEEC